MFYPVPNVDSALLNVKIQPKYADIDAAKFSAFVKTCFSMRRKTLLNNLSKTFSKEKLKECLTEETLKKRAETLSLDEFVELFKKLS